MSKKVHVLWHEIKRLKSEEPRSTLNRRQTVLPPRYSLKWHVLNHVQQRYKTDEEIECFFRDISTHGCVSGMIAKLCWYNQTHRFHDRFYDDIEELREEWEDSAGEPLKIRGDLKNFLAWFGFEETACRIANDLGLEI